MSPVKNAYWTLVKGEALSRKDKFKPVPDSPKAIINEKLDEALDESFPASDPVSLGHSEHVGQPKAKQKKKGEWPKGAVGLRGKQ